MNYLERVKEKKKERSALDARWQIDEDLLYLKKYIMRDAEKKNTVPDIVNVTLNLPGRFANDIISMLGTAKEQSIVETEDKNLDTTEIEDFRRAAFGAANARLRLQGKFELNPWWDFHSCIRGGASALCTFQMEDGILVPEVTSWDIRSLFYDIGTTGLDWGAKESTRSKQDIEAEKWAQGNKFVNVSGNTKVLNVWDTAHREIWLDDKQVFEEKHNYGFCPIVVQFVVLGSMLDGADSLGHQGEGIFFLIREAVPELERLISIMQTLNLKSVKPPIKQKLKGKGEPAEYEDVMAMGAGSRIEPDEDIAPIDFGDAQRSAQLAYGILHDAIREATVAASDLGIIESPPASGVRAMVAGESRDQLLSPRLGNKARMNEGLADMFTAQVIQMGGSVELGTPGHKRTFQTSKLDGQYEGYYKYTIKSAAVDAGRASLYAAYGDAIPDKAKRVEILQREDPDGDDRQSRWEEIERIVPAIKINRNIRALLEMAERGDKYAELEAEIASNYMGITLQQILAGEVSPPAPEPEKEPKQVLSLFGGQSSKGAQATPREEE